MPNQSVIFEHDDVEFTATFTTFHVNKAQGGGVGIEDLNIVGLSDASEELWAAAEKAAERHIRGAMDYAERGF